MFAEESSKSKEDARSGRRKADRASFDPGRHMLRWFFPGLGVSMNHEIDRLIGQRLKTLQIIVMAAIMSLVTYVGIAFLLIWQEALEPMAIPTILPPVLSAVGVSTLLVANFIVKGLIEKARNLNPPIDRLGPYQTAVIVGVALRESAGVIGLVLTLLTGALLWVCLLSALAAFAILSNFPTRQALENLIRDAPPLR